jgi:DNA-binding NarL/FixJ family response regulator
MTGQRLRSLVSDSARALIDPESRCESLTARPLRAVPAAVERGAIRRTDVARAQAMEGPRKRILCVEDDRETAALIVEELVDRGFEVEIAHDGQEGLARILREAPNLVLADISMPVMSGFELLERLTAVAPRFANMPFVFLTALADRDDELKGRQLGADDYVTKPVDFELLVAIIRARLAQVARLELSPQNVELSEREIETLTWAARGKTSAEIALILGLSKRTVDFHIDSARAKLGVATRIEAAIKAASCRLIAP